MDRPALCRNQLCSLLFSTGLYCALLCFTGLYWALLGFNKLYWALLGVTGLFWAFLGFNKLYCAVIFTGSAPRPIQYISCDVRDLYVFLSVHVWKPSFPVNWRPLREANIANIGIPLDVYKF